MKFNPDKMLESYQQCVSYAVYLADNRKAGIRAHKALDKAMGVIEDNESVVFKHGLLQFTTPKGKTRIVTQFGCHETCDCKGQMSYHFAMWQILDRYFKLLEIKPRSLTGAEMEEVHRSVMAASARHHRFQAEKPGRLKADKLELLGSAEAVADYEWRMGL